MKPFMDQNFLLETESARTLYHSFAAAMPVVDYHCHISPREIYENRRFTDIAEAWLSGDHYKWRLMRTLGVEERLVSGDASGFEKFSAFANVLPQIPGNPVYHWAHLELQRFFNCDTPLNENTAKEIWEHCNRLLQRDETLRVRGIIERSRVDALCTTDDPIDSLEWHEKLRDDPGFPTKVLPAFRPDKALNIEKSGFLDYLSQLAQAAGMPIDNVQSLKDALLARMDYFNQMGCCASDHGIDAIGPCFGTGQEAEDALQCALGGGTVSEKQACIFRNHLLMWLGKQYAKYGWVMELHLGAMRNTNKKSFAAMGADTGFDCISPFESMGGLAALLDGLAREDSLPRTLIFSLNPIHNMAINTLCGCFQKAYQKGWVQQGSAWWFNDSLPGMVKQLTDFASTTALSAFVGMLTDSRSFLSYTRHEYFRRILCNLLGDWVEKGLYPADLQSLGKLVQDVSYYNAADFFGLQSCMD